MPLLWRGLMGMSCSNHSTAVYQSRWILLALTMIWLASANAMTEARIAELRQETVGMFYHGFDNYMRIAFPEDELRPVTCVPLTRDSRNPRNVELNDVLGNYSLTLIDSLSTLAILASAPSDLANTGAKALQDFQKGVASLVLQYGDGTTGPSGKGLRGRGFDVDSKVQVFETVIRGVGGLLSAHLFAAGELPITGYNPRRANGSEKLKFRKGEIPAIVWPGGFRYNGQLLRLALDLGQRLLPAFYTATGMPYPRVNLRHGIPFYQNSPLNKGQSDEHPPAGAPEITETCSAGAGSLVLEFTVLSRLTNDPRFEQLAKRAFWAVWHQKSDIGLLGAGIDAENGQWIGPYAGIGAGTDSFFEYALKTHILLSGHDQPNLTVPFEEPHQSWLDPNTIHHPLSEEQNSPEAFLAAWQQAHAAVKRHLYSGTHHPHYVNVHLNTGSPQAYWIDSLGAYYPGLLTLAGEVEEAIETNLLYTALWTRYAALPERWSVKDGHIEGGLGWWPGRPEFIESNYHLYRATRDPWYLHVGEMVLEDIKRRCWTPCGWSGLQDVRTGELSDRMESFFLGETAKYLYLLFDPDHPLNSLDAAYVFTTEGHPLLIPKERTRPVIKRRWSTSKALQPHTGKGVQDTCPAPPPNIPFTVSATAARRDIFHAASLIGLHHIQNHHAVEARSDAESGKSQQDTPVNYTYYPWTLPPSLMPVNGTCDPLRIPHTFSIEFPVNAPVPTLGQSNFVVFGPQGLIRRPSGIEVNSLSGLRLGMVYETPSPILFQRFHGPLMESWRVSNIANMPMGRDELLFIPRDVIGPLTDPSFTRVRSSVYLDIVLQLENTAYTDSNTTGSVEEFYDSSSDYDEEYLESSTDTDFDASIGTSGLATRLSSYILAHLREHSTTLLPEADILQTYPLTVLPAMASTGIGAAPIIDVPEAPDPAQGPQSERLTWSKIYFAGEACNAKLPLDAPIKHEVIIIRRGGCTFSEKLANIPSFTPTARSLKLVIVISDNETGMWDGETASSGEDLFSPLLDKMQVTPSGLVRHHQICMVMVNGGDVVEKLFRRTRSLGLRRRYHIESQGLVVGNILVT